VFDIFCEDDDEYLLRNSTFFTNDTVNDLSSTPMSRKSILQDFVNDIKELMYPLSEGVKIVGDNMKIPEIELVTEDIPDNTCSITGVKPPYINVKINCKCFSSKGRTLSLMALAGIVNNITEEVGDNCPFCRERITFNYIEKKSSRKQTMSLEENDNDEIPTVFNVDSDEINKIMSDDAIKLIEAYSLSPEKENDDDESGEDI